MIPTSLKLQLTAWRCLIIGIICWAHIGSPSGVSTSTVTTVGFNGVTFVLNGTTYALADGFLIFDPSAPATPMLMPRPLVNCSPNGADVKSY